MTDDDPDDASDTSRVPLLISIFGLLVLTYTGGAFSAVFETFPYPQLLKPPFKALAAQMEKRATVLAELPPTIWHEVRRDGEGVVHASDEAFEGYTLYASGHRAGAFLIDMEGEVVHEWHAPFREVWPDAPHVDDPVPTKNIYWRKMHLFDNGDVLAVYAGAGDTPWGYGLAKFDADSNLLWTYDERVHHDFDVAEDGTIYAVTHRFRDTETDPVRGLPHLPRQITEDFIVELSPDGEERKRYSLVEGLVHSDYLGGVQMQPEPGRMPMETEWDLLHANAVEVVGSSFASHYDFVEPDDLIFSARDTDQVGILDFEDEEIVWATRGFWSEQHDPDPLPNGHVMVFDNNGHAGPGGQSRIVEYEPLTNKMPWIYTGTRDTPFWSKSAGTQQPLPNGHVLITSSIFGRIFEVTRDGEIVWEFLNPERRTLKSKEYLPLALDAQRFEPDELEFVGGE